jgi:hypothetical protein
LICIIVLSVHYFSKGGEQQRKHVNTAHSKSEVSAARLVGERHWIVLRAAREAYLEDLARLGRELYLKPTMGADAHSKLDDVDDVIPYLRALPGAKVL